MPQFYASTSRGLVDVLFGELNSLGVKILDKDNGGVSFEGNWEDCYKVNLCSRIASRIIKPILDFPAYTAEDLYNNVRKHDFTKYISPNQSIKIEASVSFCALKDQRFVAMKIKDAIVDQFREEFGERPDVDNDNPSLRIFVRAYKNNFSLAIDTSGESLFKRGYRKESGLAPIKETLSAGLLHIMDWDRETSLIDPMCGSGTILIEAALMALNVAPGTFRNKFGFMHLKNFNTETWEKVLKEVMDQEKENTNFQFYGSDLDYRVLQIAKENAKRAGVDHLITFTKESVATFAPRVEKGLIVTNPPYGSRIGDEENLRDVYRDFSFSLKHRFKGWTAWILSGNKELIADLRLKAVRKFFVFNGPIECRFLKYEIF